MDRVAILCTYLQPCKSFADIGCDHGYVAEYMLKHSLCEKAYITDVSAKCLAKAEKSLAIYIDCGSCISVCCDGLDGVPKDTEFVVIAGMGGEEIIKILKKGFIPRKFLFQPMKNAKELRKYLLDAGCHLSVDDTFYDGYKYYPVIKGETHGVASEKYNEKMLAFGRDSLSNPVFKNYIAAEISKLENYLENDMTESSKNSLLTKLQFFKETWRECN